MGIERHFLSPTTPLPSAAARFLAGEWSGGHLDLGRELAVVPTRQAGRRLREALAVLASSRNAAVFPPRVVTPESLLTQGAEEGRIATAMDTRLAWAEVLLGIDFERFPHLFPSPPARRDFNWALGTATELARVKRLLAEGGLCMRDVAGGRQSGFPEGARWRELAELERLYRETMSRKGRSDPEEAKIERARRSELPDAVERVTLLGAPDPPPLAMVALERFSERVQVRVAVYAESGDAGNFDAWGRPLTHVWSERVIELTGDVFHVRSDPPDQADRAAELLAGFERAERVGAVGAADAAVIPFLERALPARCGRPAYNPDGRPAGAEELAGTLGVLRDLMRAPEFDLCGELLRCPVFFRHLERRSGFPPVERLLREWDAFAVECLPGDLQDALTLARERGDERMVVGRVLEAIRSLLGELRDAPLYDTLPVVLREIHQGSAFDEGREADRRYLATAGEVMLLLEDLRDSPFAGRLTGGADGLHLLLALLAERRIEEDRPSDAIDVLGWLELLWEDAPYLVLTGMNEGVVPETLTGDAFLPESLRRELGLKHNTARFSRDAYMMETLVRSRRDGGRTEVVFGRWSDVGEPMRPSRLLLRTRDNDLPDRVERLFAEPPPPVIKPAWSSPWRFTPRAEEPLAGISVTQFGRYLRCPFRFYLSDVLRMDAFDTAKAEMDDGEFGSLCHAVLEAFANETEVRDSRDADEIRRFFSETLDTLFRRRYGPNPSAPLEIQMEAAAARLERLAEIQAGERRLGWRIESGEWRFPGGDSLTLGGIPLRGVVDRIERNEDSGAYRIVDYKTSDRNRIPEEDHIVPLKRDESSEDFPDYAVFEREGKAYRWIGLQLPLYRWALRDRCGEDVACAYFNLPRAVTETGVYPWEDQSRELQMAALRCAAGVVESIRAGRFWPPSEKVSYDAFEGLFFGDPWDLVDPRVLRGKGEPK